MTTVLFFSSKESGSYYILKNALRSFFKWKHTLWCIGAMTIFPSSIEVSGRAKKLKFKTHLLLQSCSWLCATALHCSPTWKITNPHTLTQCRHVCCRPEQREQSGTATHVAVMNYQQVQLITKLYGHGAHQIHNGARQLPAIYGPSHVKTVTWVREEAAGAFVFTTVQSARKTGRRRVSHYLASAPLQKGHRRLFSVCRCVTLKLYANRRKFASPRRERRVAMQERWQHKDKLLSSVAPLTHKNPQFLRGASDRQAL